MNDHAEIRAIFMDIANLRDRLKAQSEQPHYIRDMNDVDLNNAMWELDKALWRLSLREVANEQKEEANAVA